MARTLVAIAVTIPFFGCQDHSASSRVAAAGDSANGEISVHQEQAFACFEKSFKGRAVSFESDRNADGPSSASTCMASFTSDQCLCRLHSQSPLSAARRWVYSARWSFEPLLRVGAPFILVVCSVAGYVQRCRGRPPHAKLLHHLWCR